MSTYRTTRGKLVSVGGISLAVHEHDGSLMIRVGEKRIDLTEDEASRLHDLMSDVVIWDSAKDTTEAKFDKMGDESDDEIESGKLDDERAYPRRNTGVTVPPVSAG